MAWKKTMQAFHTAGLPPSSGRIIFPTIGWTMNNSDALTNSVTANSSGTGGTPVANRAMRTQTGVVVLGVRKASCKLMRGKRGSAHPLPRVGLYLFNPLQAHPWQRVGAYHLHTA